ncbi:MAG: TfoX/Sxy family protein [Bacteroidota bacterium]
MNEAEALFHEIAETLPEAKKGKMFGAFCIKAPNGKALAMLWQDHMVFKFTGESEKEAASLDGVEVFNPMQKTAMSGWYQVPYDYADKWKSFAESALVYVQSLKKK